MQPVSTSPAASLKLIYVVSKMYPEHRIYILITSKKKIKIQYIIFIFHEF